LEKGKGDGARKQFASLLRSSSVSVQVGMGILYDRVINVVDLLLVRMDKY